MRTSVQAANNFQAKLAQRSNTKRFQQLRPNDGFQSLESLHPLL